MKKLIVAIVASVALAEPASAHVFNPPEPSIPDNWPPACQSIELRGPDADFYSRQRRKLAKRVFGYPVCPPG